MVAKADEIDREIDEYLITAQEREKNPMSPDSAKTARYVLKLFVKDSKVRWPSEINEQKVAIWVRGLRAAGKSQQTLRMYAAYVKTFTRVLHASGKLKIDPLVQYSLRHGAAELDSQARCSTDHRSRETKGWSAL